MNTTNNNTDKNTAIENAINALKTEWTEGTRSTDAEGMADFIESLRLMATLELDLTKEHEVAEGLTQEDMTDVLIWAAREFLVEDMAMEMHSQWEIEDMPDAKAIADMAELMSEQSQWTMEEIRQLISDYSHR